MKPSTINVFDERDEEIAELLTARGMKRVVARTLVYLKNVESARQRDIELGAGMIQQDVGRALREMYNNKWVSWKTVKQEKKRGYKMYTLIVNLDTIISEMEEKAIADIARTMKNIEEMKAVCFK